jgi:hypothetical protein
MNVLAPRTPQSFEDEVKAVYQALEPPKAVLQIKGSASLASQRYFSDYDFFCNVDYPPTLRFINSIRKKLDELLFVYPIEVKIETNEGKKYRYFKQDKIKKLPDNIKLIKVDIVVNIDFIFTEVSCIYLFTQEKMTTEEFVEELYDEIKELTKEGNYYKALKRMFSIFKVNEEDAKLVALTRYFNSPTGRDYQNISNYDALKLVDEHYSSQELDKRMESNLKTLGISTDSERNSLYKKVNKSAKRFLKKF